MQNTHNILREALKEALQADGGLAVFRHYGFEPSKKPQQINPFRQERTSSFFVIERNGKCIFKDFGDDSLKGGAWKFAQLYENTSDQTFIFQLFCNIYGLGYASIATKPKSITKKLKQKPSNESSSKKLLQITTRDFNQEELDFWYQKGFISPKILAENVVKAVEAFEIMLENGKILQYKDLKFVFAYEIVANKNYKLYMPKPNYRVYSKSKTVFLPDLSDARLEFGENYAYTFGLDTLKPAPFIICGGEPDCLALKSLGYNACTLGDERTNLPEYLWEFLAKKWGNTNPKQFLKSVLYDTDFTGIKNSKTLAHKYQIAQLSLPKLYQQSTKDLPKPMQNDLCDYLGLYGNDASLEISLARQHLRTRDYAIPAIPNLVVEEYLSEKIAPLVDFIQNNKKIQIDADAGVGKTYTMLVDLSKKIKTPILFCVPFAIQVEQIEQEYTPLIDDLVCFTNKDTQALTEEDKEIFLNRPVGQVNVCTIDRIRPVYERLQSAFENEIIVVIDESHLLTSEYAYRTHAIHDTLEVCRKALKIIYLSATPDYSLCRFSGFQLLQIRRVQNPVINIQPIDYEGTAKQNLLRLLGNAYQYKKEGEIKIIRINNKTLAKVIASLLIKEGVYQENEIDFVFSEKRKGQTTPSRESIVEHSLVPDNVRLLFVTSCFDCGINILNENIGQIISFESQYTDNCLDTLKQFIARFRRINTLDVLVCKPKRLLNLENAKPKIRLYERLKNDAQNKLKLLPYFGEAQIKQIKQANFAKMPTYLKSNHDISAIQKLIFWHKQKEAYSINYNYIRFILKEYERKNLNSVLFYDYLQNELPQIAILPRKAIQNVLDEVTQQQFALLLAEEKLRKQARQHFIVALIRDDEARFFDAVNAIYRDQSLKDKIKKYFATSPSKDAPQLSLLFVALASKINIDTIPTIQECDEDIITLSHRYFQLLDIQIPKIKIPDLLQNFAPSQHFNDLIRTLNNHIYLFAHHEAGENWEYLLPDARKRTDGEWLAKFYENVEKWQPNTYLQKRAETYQKTLNLEKERLQTLGMQHDTLTCALKHLKESKHSKTEQREILRKINAQNNKIKRQNQVINELNQRLTESQISAWELEELSAKINRFRPHSADWQGTKINMRLLNSLFETETQRRTAQKNLPLVEDETLVNKTKNKEKTFIQIIKRKRFEDILLEIGFSDTQTSTYLYDLRYQINLDIEHNLSKKGINSQKLSIAPTLVTQTDMLNGMGNNPELNEHGYPSMWE